MGITKPIRHFNPRMKEGDIINPLYVGINVSSSSNVVYLMLSNGDKLVYFLREDATLLPFDRKIFVLNPRQVSKFKESYNDL